MDLDDYKSVLIRAMGSAWRLVQQNVQKAQKQQKLYYDRSEKNSKFVVGDTVFVCMPAQKAGQMRKLACPFQRPYRVLEVYPSGLDPGPVDKPGARPIRVAMERVRSCPEEIECITT